MKATTRWALILVCGLLLLVLPTALRLVREPGGVASGGLPGGLPGGAPGGAPGGYTPPTVDTTDIQQITDFPDLAAELEKQVAGASALVVISPFFLYTAAEVAVVERFVADGGRLLLISDPDVESDSASDTTTWRLRST